jgi:hypothetical protein
MPESVKFEMTVTATGVVHDADGNVVASEVPLTSTVQLTDDEAQAFRQAYADEGGS